MKFKQPLTSGRLIKRYKRFLADIKLDSGEMITAHCPNSGSMKSCIEQGWRVMVSQSTNPKRKYKHTLEMVNNNICWIGINTGIPNIIVKEAIENDKISDLRGYSTIKREVKYGQNSRIDILLMNNKENCYIEVKNVTLVEADGNYYFPDAITERGKKHLFELIDVIKQGHRAVMFFVIQRSDGKIFKPATHIDTDYTNALKEAISRKVEILVYRADVDPSKIELSEEIHWEL